MDAIKKEVYDKISKLTGEKIELLTNIWLKTYEPDIAIQNLNKLILHVEMFYDEVHDEINSRQMTIKDKIKKLQEEQSKLTRLLHIDIDLKFSEDIPLFSLQQHIDQNLQDLRLQLKEREDCIEQLLLQQSELCSVLCEPQLELLCDPLPSKEEINEFVARLNELKNQKENRKNMFAQFRKDILTLCAELEISLFDEPSYSLVNNVNIKLSISNLNRLKNLSSSLNRQKDEMKDSIDTMKTKLNILWDCLDVSPAVRNKFSNQNVYTQTSYNIILQELNNCEAQKRQNIKKFVERLREEILIYWEKTLKSDQERARFVNFTNDCYTEDLLSLHELEVEDLKHFYNKNILIFEKYAEHKMLWDRMLALESKENEPGRYNNRGGQLLKEEKERKLICTKLPKLKQQLFDIVYAYEHATKRKFLVWGSNIIDVIEGDYLKRQEMKELQMSARKAGKGAMNSAQKSIMKTPMSTTKVGTTSTIKRMASVTSLCGNSTKKTRLEIQSFNKKEIKRNLLVELNSDGFTKPKSSRTLHKSPINRVIATLTEPIIRRRSKRHSNNSKRKHRKSAQKQLIPKIIVTDTITSDSTINYDMFQDQISSRSSVLIEDRTPRKVFSKNKKLPRIQTPNRLHSTIKGNNGLKSPRNLRIKTPSPSTSKLTTKNLPIII